MLRHHTRMIYNGILYWRLRYPLAKQITIEARVVIRSLRLKGSRMGRSGKVSLWCVLLLINTRFRFFILE